MKYPSMEEVNRAGHLELGRWMRHLNSPGMSAPEGAAPSIYESTRQSEAKVLDRIRERFESLGGWNPNLSKAVGWEIPHG